MKKLRAVFLMSVEMGRLARSIALASGLDLVSVTVNSVEGLEREFDQPQDLLLSFGTGVIVPSRILEAPSLLALNIHAASPEYPGRDPHHFAIYYAAMVYGATIHYMIDKIDQGPIVDVELFDVPEDATAALLLEMANAAGIELLKRFFTGFATSGAPASRGDICWGARKTRRSDFIELCRIDCGMSEKEFQRRLEATSMPGYRNLFIDLYGYRFRFEGKVK